MHLGRMAVAQMWPAIDVVQDYGLGPGQMGESFYSFPSPSRTVGLSDKRNASSKTILFEKVSGI